MGRKGFRGVDRGKTATQRTLILCIQVNSMKQRLTVKQHQQQWRLLLTTAPLPQSSRRCRWCIGCNNNNNNSPWWCNMQPGTLWVRTWTMWRIFPEYILLYIVIFYDCIFNFESIVINCCGAYFPEFVWCHLWNCAHSLNVWYAWIVQRTVVIARCTASTWLNKQRFVYQSYILHLITAFVLLFACTNHQWRKQIYSALPAVKACKSKSNWN